MSEHELLLIADLALILSGGYGISKSKQEKPYATVGYLISIAKGVVGITGYFLDDSTLKSINVSMHVCMGLCLPLFATQAGIEGGYDQVYMAPANLIVPAVSLVMYVMNDEPIAQHVVQVGLLANVVCIGYFTYKLDRFYGYPQTVLEAAAHLTGPYQMNPGIRNLILALANLCEVYFLSNASGPSAD